MTRECTLTGKTVMSGNNVSHANNKTRRRYLPNLQMASLMSEALGHSVRVRLTPAALRTVEHNHGLDNFLLTTASDKLTEEGKKLKRRVKKALEAKKKAA
jgi:large subunit ribosomal protein L28